MMRQSDIQFRQHSVGQAVLPDAHDRLECVCATFEFANLLITELRFCHRRRLHLL